MANTAEDLKMFDTIYCHSSEDMHELPDESVHLIVTSPPYNVGMEYEDVLEFDEYRGFLKRVWKECYRALVEGGRICVNVAGIGRQPYLPLQVFLTIDLLDIGCLMRGMILWHKNAGRRSTAWGSWLSASNPVLNDSHEYILVFSKGSFHRKETGESTITRDEFLCNVNTLWNISPESAKKIGHPAPFPVELPRRLIQLYTYQNDVVLDPFMGSGTTAVVAKELGRQYIGYDTNQEYVELSNQRLRQDMLFT